MFNDAQAWLAKQKKQRNTQMPLEIFDCEQNSAEWDFSALQVITASNMNKVLAKGEGKDSQQVCQTDCGGTLPRRSMEGLGRQRRHRARARVGTFGG